MSITRKLLGVGAASMMAQAIVGVTDRNKTATGTDRATAYLLSDDVTTFSVVPSGTGASLRADSLENDVYTVVNNGANDLNVYPPLGGTVGGGAVNVPYVVASGVLVEFQSMGNNLFRVKTDSLSSLAAPTGSSLVGFIQDGPQAVPRTVQDKLRESVSAMDFGAIGNGIADDSAAIAAVFDSANSFKEITDGNYNLSVDVTPASADMDLKIAPGATLSGVGKLRFSGLIPFQIPPVAAIDMLRKTVGPDYSGFYNVFTRATYSIANTGNVAVVSVFGGAEAAVASSSCFGGNFVAYARNATATAIGLEIDVGADVSGGTAYALVLVSSNQFAARNAIQIQSNTAAQFDDGIKFNFQTTFGCVRKALITASAGYAASIENILTVAGISATLKEIDIPSFAVGATPGTGALNRLQVNGATTGNSPSLETTGPDSNIPFIQNTKGTGIYVFRIGGRDAYRINYVANMVNRLAAVPSATGNAVGHVAEGSDTNISMFDTPKGSGDKVLTNGNFIVQQVGKGLYVKEGSNAKQGIATLVAGTVTVANTSVTANSRIFLQRQTDGGTVGASYSITRSAGISFTVTAKDGAGATNTTDTSILAYQIFEPA